MKLTVNIEKIDLDGLINKIADDKFGNNILTRELIKTANKAFDGDKKIVLLNQILENVNRNNLAEELLGVLVKYNEKFANIIRDLDLELGNITLEK